MERERLVVDGMRSMHPEDIKMGYFMRLKKAKIEPDELLKCEMLNLDYMGKDIARNLRSIKRLGCNCKGLYFQLNPSAKWSITIGVLPVVLDAENLTQDELYYTQEATFSCKGSDDAAGIYYRSRKMPCADAVWDFLWANTMAQIWQATQKERFNMAIYAGVAHSDNWIQMNPFYEE